MVLGLHVGLTLGDTDGGCDKVREWQMEFACIFSVCKLPVL